MIKSPFTDQAAVLEKRISPFVIEQGYRSNYNIEVRNLLQGKEIQLYRCETTGFRFFYPLDIAGDGQFYSKLQKYDWYYRPWKWEHEFCKRIIRKGSKILEVGCAKGDFLRRIKEDLGVEVVGLELNKEAIAEGERDGTLQGIHIVDETIQDHAKSNKGRYDLVCSFQVLEHIPDVSSFLQAKIDCLKENGRLVIAVPNNDSFIKFDEGDSLNQPPHHMGLWNPDSLKSLEEIFNIKLIKIYFEPLQEIHFQWFYFVQIRRIYTRSKFIGKVIEKLTQSFYKPFLRLSRSFIKGHTMIAVFEK